MQDNYLLIWISLSDVALWPDVTVLKQVTIIFV